MNILKKINLKNKNILIVGGSGLLGSKIIDQLSNFNCNIYNFDIIPTKKTDNINFVKINLKNLKNNKNNKIKKNKT